MPRVLLALLIAGSVSELSAQVNPSVPDPESEATGKLRRDLMSGYYNQPLNNINLKLREVGF